MIINVIAPRLGLGLTPNTNPNLTITKGEASPKYLQIKADSPPPKTVIQTSTLTATSNGTLPATPSYSGQYHPPNLQFMTPNQQGILTNGSNQYPTRNPYYATSPTTPSP
ncbi:hypothetical protein DPMN_034123 [Dreissena polymorpha]|uniref:Uncharacterized protein n=1 Tax=Dreissena polymorpha TaxID=45954 RepID=A0A9D4RJG3_DREPO|nr:hypothetical protein DPMN_034123 [Dreissena polymorpha]